jgi:hypothetical protein
MEVAGKAGRKVGCPLNRGLAQAFPLQLKAGAFLIEKLDYLHRNPVQRGLVTCPEDWTWSSARHYALTNCHPERSIRFAQRI